jgi:hypothetical protein
LRRIESYQGFNRSLLLKGEAVAIIMDIKLIALILTSATMRIRLDFAPTSSLLMDKRGGQGRASEGALTIFKAL